MLVTGWTMFNISLYFLSNEFGSWTKGRDDCVKRDSHLVVIDSDKEQVQRLYTVRNQKGL